MFLLWIVGLAFVGSGLAAFAFGLRGLETQFGSALIVGGMTFISSGFVIAALGLVIRQLGRLRDALNGRANLPAAGVDGAIPAIETATLQRPSLARPPEPSESTARDLRAISNIGRAAGQGSRRPERRDIRQTFTVIQSDTVNNMNYELRTDGTIVAMLPGRALEFSSVDELRKYLTTHPEDGEALPSSRHSA